MFRFSYQFTQHYSHINDQLMYVHKYNELNFKNIVVTCKTSIKFT